MAAAGMENIARNNGLLLLLLLFITDLSCARPYLQRHKRQIRKAHSELTVNGLHIKSTIVSRYALTVVQSVMVNTHSEAKEAIFDLDLPDSAFISNFSMTANEKTYVADVKEKHQAKKMYNEARKQGKTAAHVGTRDRETVKFRVLVNVEAGGEIVFALTYEELLRRHLGKYEYAVSVPSWQVVQNLSVEITISERTGIEYVRVLPLRTSRLMTNSVPGESKVPPSTQVEKGTYCTRVTYTPTPTEQAAHSRPGVTADFVLHYDVSLKDVAGDVQIYNGYFVHYFAPRGLPPIQKNVIFVIDVSGSMFGTKIKQTKSAMHVILNDLHRDDSFNIITFSDVVHVWRPGQSILATAQNKKSAKDYVNKIEADGWTDINAALLAAASIFNQTSHKPEKEKKIPLIIFLTDGEATSGVLASSRILSNAQKAMEGKISLFCLAFGEDADYNLMKRLSLENRGIARRIYEYSDATLQLKGFYDEIASPLLFDIELNYLEETAQNVTQTLFPNYFEGSELVVAGKLKSGTKDLKVRLTAHDQKQQVSLENDISMESNSTEPNFGCSSNVEQIQWFVQRLWAFFTIKDLLEARIKANDSAARRLLTEKATNLSLKYNFVTPVTSLIIVKPEDEESRKTTTQAAAPSVTTTSAPVTSSSMLSTTAATKTTSLKAKMTSTPWMSKTTSRGIKSTLSTKTTIGTVVATSTTTISTETSPRITAVQVTGAKGHSSLTPSLVTTNPALQKQTTVVLSTNAILTTSSDSRPNVPSHPVATLQPHTNVPVGTVRPMTEKASPALSVGARISTNVPTTEIPPDLSAALMVGTSLFSTVRGWGAQATTTPQLPTTFPVDPTFLRFLVLPDSTELHHETFANPMYVESLNPPPFYSFLKEADVAGIVSEDFYAENPEDTEFIYGGDFYSENPEDTEFVFGGANLLVAPGLQTFMSSVDGDPHFIVNFPKSQEKLCFTLDGRPGDILRLLSDPVAGITVNGHLMKAPLKVGFESRLRTYLDLITVVINRPRSKYVVNISLQNLTLTGEKQQTFAVNHPVFFQKPNLAVRVVPSTNATIWIGHNVELLIIFHHYQHPSYLQLDHLGFYIVKAEGLSSSSGGLLGQFQNCHMEVIDKKLSHDLTLSGTVKRNSQTAPATLVKKAVKDSTAQVHEAKCWLVKHGDIEEILDGKYLSYLVSDLQEV
ncbi:inter-alpha-trypsin inhibitor heavy chain H6 [Xenopus laevis]|uniref:Inter-alpha-trypsin inhibitor heavy chain H6 n=1 Tax=Xenopus laevis TaxID=8355 RepID=A0A8J1LHR4_XENLA|nr:inter-alpha-trypsin inhibitor heavy chain H6 [Xenopus laevis]